MGTAGRLISSHPFSAAHRRRFGSNVTAVWRVGEVMKLRDHTLMSYNKLYNWPPAWTWVDGPEDKGEVGILRMVLLAKTRPADRCFPLIGYERSCYLGCLLFEYRIFRRQITKLLQQHCNRPIVEIGDLDLSQTLSARSHEEGDAKCTSTTPLVALIAGILILIVPRLLNIS
jgi:Protein of unknown function (DUF3096)